MTTPAMTGSTLHDERENLRAIQSATRQFLRGEWSPAKFRELIDSGTGYSTALWEQICALGWPGTLLPESVGGAGGTFVELGAILQECGYAIAPSPLQANAVAAWIVTEASSTGPKAALAGAATGAAPLTLALHEAGLTANRMNVALSAKADGGGFRIDGVKLFVPSAASASAIVTAARLEDGGLGLFLVPQSATGLRAMKALDWSALSEVTYDGVEAGGDALIARGAEAERLLSAALDMQDAALCAEILGVAEAALELAVTYAKERVAFGRPIGSFQAVKHRLVNLRADIEVARAVLSRACRDAAFGLPEAHVSVARAAFWTIDALKHVPEGALQVFGGIGFTWEHDIHLYLRRSATLASQLGERSTYRDVVAAHLDTGAL